MADQRAVAAARLGERCARRAGAESAAAPPRVASGRNQPRGARNWIACPSHPTAKVSDVTVSHALAHVMRSSGS